MIARKHIYILLFITAVTFQIAKSNDTLSLPGAIQLALENNYQIKIQRNNTAIAENNNTWGMAGAMPIVSAGINETFNYNDDLDQLSQITNAVNPYVSVNWTLFNGFSAVITKQKLAYLYEISEGSAAILVENTIQATMLAYYNVLLQRKQLEVFSEVMKLSGDRYKYMQERKKLGSAVTFDILQSKDNYLSDSSNYVLQEMNYKMALRNLNLLLAEPGDKTYELTTEFDLEEVLFDITDLKQKMESGNKTLQNQYINQKILEQEVRSAKSAMYPTLTLGTGYNHYFNDADPVVPMQYNPQYYNLYVRLSLSVTLFNGLRTKTAIKNAKIEQESGAIQIEEIKHSLNNNLYTTFELYNARMQLKNLAISREETSQLNLKIAEDKFKTGSINSFNYRDIQLSYLSASIQRLQSIYNLVETYTDLLRLTGSIVSEGD